MKKKISLILLSIVQVVVNAMVMIDSTKEAKLFLSTLKEGLTGMPEETIKQITEVFTLDFAKSFIFSLFLNLYSFSHSCQLFPQ